MEDATEHHTLGSQRPITYVSPLFKQVGQVVKLFAYGLRRIRHTLLELM